MAAFTGTTTYSESRGVGDLEATFEEAIDRGCCRCWGVGKAVVKGAVTTLSSLLSGCDEGQLKAAIGERNSVKCALQNRSE